MMSYGIEDLVQASTDVKSCGEIVVEFYNDDDKQSKLDQELFEVGEANGSSYFKVLKTEDSSKMGRYPIKYRVYYAQYQDY